MDFDVLGGEIHAVVGENGAGKSTLVKILAGVVTPDAGSLRLEGRSVRFGSPGDAHRAGVVLVHQELQLAPDLTVTENYFLGELPPIVAWRGLHRRAERDLAALGVDSDPRQLARGLPAATQQLITIARALRREARILILDEPTSSLSIAEADRLFHTLNGLRQRGLGMIYVSHRLDEIFRLADRVTILRDGRRVNTVAVRETSTDAVVHWMIGKRVTREARVRKTDRAGPAFTIEAEVSGQLAKVEMRVAPGEVLGVTGAAGSGVSALVSALAGVRGRAVVNGQVVRGPATARTRGIGVLPEERKTQGLVLGLSVSGNVTLANLAAYTWGRLVLSHRRMSASAASWRDQLSIRAPDLGAPVATLSGGNQQKVLFAKTLDPAPRLLVLAEPTRGVDVGSKAEIAGLIARLSEQGKAVLMVSSDVPEIGALADRIVVLREGRIKAELAGGTSEAEVLKHVTGAV